MRKNWTRYAWAAWVVVIFAIAARPFLWHLNLFRRVDPHLYLRLLVVLPLLVLGGVAYHFVRRLGFWRVEPAVFPVAVLLFVAFYSPLAVAVGLWIVLAAFVTGKQVMNWMGTDAGAASSIAAGLGLFSYALFPIGLAGGFRVWVFVLLFAVPLAAFGKKNLGSLARGFQTMRTAWVADPESTAPQVSLAVILSLILALFTAAAVITPAWEGDAIRAHLALARAYLIEHSIAVPAPLNYGYYPQGFEVLLSAAYALGGQTAAQLVNPIFFCLALALAYRIARTCGIARSWSAAGVALGASLPFLHAAGSIIKNDLPFAAFQLTAVLFYLCWREDHNFRWILGSAFFLAMSFSVKDVAIFGALPLGLAYAQAVWREQGRVRAAATLLLVLVVFGLFWQTRTYVAKGNPLYPASVDTVSMSRRRRSSKLARIGRWLSSPIFIHFHGKTYAYPTPNPLGFLLLLLLPLCFVRPREASSRRKEAVLWFFLLLYLLPWSYSFAVPRYAIGPLLLLSILGVRRLALIPSWLSLPAVTGALVFGDHHSGNGAGGDSAAAQAD